MISRCAFHFIAVVVTICAIYFAEQYTHPKNMRTDELTLITFAYSFGVATYILVPAIAHGAFLHKVIAENMPTRMVIGGTIALTFTFGIVVGHFLDVCFGIQPKETRISVEAFCGMGLLIPTTIQLFFFYIDKDTVKP